MGPKNVEYRESIYVGYRYFDSANKNVLFPFGYGLSYVFFFLLEFDVDYALQFYVAARRSYENGVFAVLSIPIVDDRVVECKLQYDYRRTQSLPHRQIDCQSRSVDYKKSSA